MLGYESNADGGHRERRVCLGNKPGLKAESEDGKREAHPRGCYQSSWIQPGLNPEPFPALRRDKCQKGPDTPPTVMRRDSCG